MSDAVNPIEPQQHSILTESAIFAGRLFMHWRRYPTVALQSVLFPTVLLITYSLLIGKSMIRLTGSDSLDVLIPVCALAGAMSGSLSAGMMMPHDRESGLLTRLWIMPVHRASALTGTLLAEALRTLAGTVVILATGYLLGYRFDGNLLALIGYLLIPSLVVVVFTTIVVSLALRAEARTVLPWVGTGIMGLAFAAMIPVNKIPAMLRPLAHYQPVAPAIDAMRAMSHGSAEIWLPLALAAGWIVAIAAVFAPLAVRSYRQAAESGKVGD